MTPEEKKKLKTKMLNQEGNKRSWSEITADLELELWAERHSPFPTVRNRVIQKKVNQ